MRNIIVVLFSLFLLSCGSNTSITKPELIKTSLIRQMSWQKNTMTAVLNKTNITAKIKYYNMSNPSEKYEGWTTGTLDDTLICKIPVKDNSQYRITLSLKNSTFIQDTTFILTITDPDTSFLRLDVVDVGQGDGIFIRTPENQNIVVDGGYGTRNSNNQNGPEENKPMMLNYILSEGVETITYMIETHPHGDHSGGLNDIRNNNDVNVQRNITAESNAGYQVGDDLDLNSAVTFRFYNINYPENSAQETENNMSIVLYITYGDTQYLLTGDAEAEVEYAMKIRGFTLSADLLKVGHHGSNSSSSTDFLSSVGNQFCKVALISYGSHNDYGHPANTTRFNSFAVFGTNVPQSSGYATSSNYHYNVGTIKTYSDGKLLVVRY